MENNQLSRGLKYLAAAERSFNLDNNQERITLRSFQFKPCYCTNSFTVLGDRLLFHHDTMLFEWSSDFEKSKFLLLEPSTHQEIVDWIEARAGEARLKKDFHFLNIATGATNKQKVVITPKRPARSQQLKQAINAQLEIDRGIRLQASFF